jgi:hypothetical protein
MKYLTQAIIYEVKSLFCLMVLEVQVQDLVTLLLWASGEGGTMVGAYVRTSNHNSSQEIENQKDWTGGQGLTIPFEGTPPI